MLWWWLGCSPEPAFEVRPDVLESNQDDVFCVSRDGESRCNYGAGLEWLEFGDQADEMSISSAGDGVCGRYGDHWVCGGYMRDQEFWDLEQLAMVSATERCTLDDAGAVECTSSLAALDDALGGRTVSVLEAAGEEVCAIAGGQVFCSSWEVALWETRAEPVGLRMSSTWGYVLDGEQVPIGVVGEGPDWEHPEPPSQGFTLLDVSLNGACGQDLEGELHCWGAPLHQGELLAPSLGFLDFEMMDGTFCGLDRDRILSCWGQIFHQEAL